jgi:DNA-binding response OmpR family regulator
MSNYKVLIADDEPQIREILRVYFQKEGFQVIEAENGQDALDKVDAEHPDIILLDIMMPVMDGLQVCEKVRKQYDIPIIMLTAKDDDDDRILGLETGADDYITKPFNTREVVARVKAVVRRAGDRYFLGAGTDSSARALDIPLDFLEPGKEYDATVYADDLSAGPTDAAPTPEDGARDRRAYRIETRAVTSGDTLHVEMAPGGGQAVSFIPR